MNLAKQRLFGCMQLHLGVVTSNREAALARFMCAKNRHGHAAAKTFHKETYVKDLADIKKVCS